MSVFVCVIVATCWRNLLLDNQLNQFGTHRDTKKGRKEQQQQQQRQRQRQQQQQEQGQGQEQEQGQEQQEQQEQGQEQQEVCPNHPEHSPMSALSKNAMSAFLLRPFKEKLSFGQMVGRENSTKK